MSAQANGLGHGFRPADRAPTGNAVLHFVAKVVKTFGDPMFEAESLDDFRYEKRANTRRKMLHSVARRGDRSFLSTGLAVG